MEIAIGLLQTRIIFKAFSRFKHLSMALSTFCRFVDSFGLRTPHKTKSKTKNWNGKEDPSWSLGELHRCLDVCFPWIVMRLSSLSCSSNSSWSCRSKALWEKTYRRQGGPGGLTPYFWCVKLPWCVKSHGENRHQWWFIQTGNATLFHGFPAWWTMQVDQIEVTHDFHSNFC